MDNYEFTPISNIPELEDLKQIYGDALAAFQPQFINAEIPMEKAFAEGEIDIGLLPETFTGGSYQRILTLHVAVNALPEGEGASNVARLIGELGYIAHRKYMLSYWMSDIPHKIKVLFYVR